MKNQDEQNPWQSLSRKTMYETPWIKIVEHKCLNPKKEPANYGVVEFKNIAIGILALDSRQNLYLVGQWRYPLEKYSWEIPKGGGRKNMDPLEEAKRELQEESGLVAKDWVKLFEMHLSNSTTDEFAIIYLAEDLIQGESAPEDTEVLKTKIVHLKEAYEMVLKGEITDAISVAGIQRAYIDKIAGI